MAKIAKDTGPSDVRQPDEPLHLRQPEVVPGSNPESAQAATRAAVLGEDNSDMPDVQETDGTESTEPGSEPDADAVTRTDPPVPTYDPSQYTVEEVKAHLADLLEEEDNPEAAEREVERIIQVERDGKNRVGITSYLE